MDGISLFSLLKNETQHTRDSFLIEYHGERNGGTNDPRCQDFIDDNLAGMNWLYAKYHVYWATAINLNGNHVILSNFTIPFKR